MFIVEAFEWVGLFWLSGLPHSLSYTETNDGWVYFSLQTMVFNKEISFGNFIMFIVKKS
jgi:hypothetical protein